MPVPGEYDNPPSYLYPPRPSGMPAPGTYTTQSGSPSTPSQRIATVQGTDTDAALSRLSAVEVGLLDDRFAQFFAGDGGGPAPRRLPIINRGTYTRTKALDKMIEAVMAADGASPRQIVSLGAGTDTRALRVLTRRKKKERHLETGDVPSFTNVIYHEIDFPRISERKRAIVQAVPEIQALLAGPVTQHSPMTWSVDLGDGNVLYSHGHDLRELKEASDVVLHGYQSSLPTLIVSECCLCYLQPDEAVSVLRYFTKAAFGSALDSQPSQRDPVVSATPSVGVVLYEPIHPNDSFGRTMVSNLAARGIEMPTLAACPDGPSQDARLTKQVGLHDRADHRTIAQIWDAWVPEAEKARVNAMEGLDEVEEWKLLASHYVVAWGYRGGFFKSVWNQLEAAPEPMED
ncbi:leucine carboxyl methyltransferase 1 [Ophiostoma piceae UAMH 11346]|uniref:Leucine carboxyl methyltransferase 1 n=1 Tax=Ophiostoma piceae (strain UAMH 11346) TaxID=1262450 RepID=S3CW06_OPHP1|nr:leucine carboxyl methyltransferase 1 [Ophiostoma piceae UAMH 11346]